MYWPRITSLVTICYVLAREAWLIPYPRKKEYSELFSLTVCLWLSVNRMQVLFNLESFKFVAERNFNYLVYTNWNVLTDLIAWICMLYKNKNENKDSIIVDTFTTQKLLLFSDIVQLITELRWHTRIFLLAAISIKLILNSKLNLIMWK